MKQETIDYFLKGAWQSVSNKYNQIAGTYGITQSLGYLLINIRQEGTPVTELANKAGVKATSLSRMLRKMEEMNLIYRQEDEIDKRSVKVFLTEFGVEKRKDAKEVVKNFNEYLHQQLPSEEIHQFNNTLQKIINLTNNYKP